MLPKAGSGGKGAQVAAWQQAAWKGFAAPTPTQSVSWPLALMGTDLISIAKTGSGKTLGFLLPAFHRIKQSSLRIMRAARCPLVRGLCQRFGVKEHMLVMEGIATVISVLVAS